MRPQLAAAVALPRHEVIGSAASPDRKSWRIVSVRLEEPVPREALRALWESLKKEQATEWGRFTCRVYLPEMDPLGGSWVDVNELMIFETPRPAPRSAPATRVEEEEGTLLFKGDRCFLVLGEAVICVPGELISWTWEPEASIVEITYSVPLDDAPETWETRTVEIPVDRADAPARPMCAGVWMR